MEKINCNDKKHARTFSTQASQGRAAKKVEPLTRSFFSNLLKLETDFYNKHYTADTLDELTQCYAKAVEYYDTIKDEIASYFIFKIQDALATKKSLKLLLEKTSQVSIRKNSILSTSTSPEDDNKKNASKLTIGESELNNEVIREKVDEENTDDEDDPAVKEFARKRKAYFEGKNKNTKASFSVMRNQKQRFVHFFHKIETQKATQKQSMNVLLDDFGCFANKNDELIQSNISSQKERLKNMLEQRKHKTFMSHTLSASSYFGHNRSMFNYGEGFCRKDLSLMNHFENVLRELDDADENQFEIKGILLGNEKPERDAVEPLQQRNLNVKSIAENNTPKPVKANSESTVGGVEQTKSIGESLELSPIIGQPELAGQPNLKVKSITPTKTQIKAQIPSEDTKKHGSSPDGCENKLIEHYHQKEIDNS